jgi:hypothetical protein
VFGGFQTDQFGDDNFIVNGFPIPAAFVECLRIGKQKNGLISQFEVEDFTLRSWPF